MLLRTLQKKHAYSDIVSCEGFNNYFVRRCKISKKVLLNVLRAFEYINHSSARRVFWSGRPEIFDANVWGGPKPPQTRQNAHIKNTHAYVDTFSHTRTKRKNTQNTPVHEDSANGQKRTDINLYAGWARVKCSHKCEDL